MTGAKINPDWKCVGMELLAGYKGSWGKLNIAGLRVGKLGVELITICRNIVVVLSHIYIYKIASNLCCHNKVGTRIDMSTQ